MLILSEDFNWLNSWSENYIWLKHSYIFPKANFEDAGLIKWERKPKKNNNKWLSDSYKLWKFHTVSGNRKPEQSCQHKSCNIDSTSDNLRLCHWKYRHNAIAQFLPVIWMLKSLTTFTHHITLYKKTKHRALSSLSDSVSSSSVSESSNLSPGDLKGGKHSKL